MAVDFPSWAYNATQPGQIVQTQAAFDALTPAGSWSKTPFATPPPAGVAPSDPGFVNTDIRLQQLLIEARVTNLMMKEAFGIRDEVDKTGLRQDIIAQDVGLTS